LGWWKDAATKLSCPVDDMTASVKCMRGKTAKEILDVTIIENPLIEVLGHFGPSVDNKVVFGDYVERAKAGKFIKKPYMAGNNHFEAGLFVMISNAANISLPANIWGIFNAAVFTCPIARLADARSNDGQVTYRYRYFGDWSNTNLIPGSGAYHTAEIPMIFGTSEEATGGAPNEPAQQKISDFMQKAWASFAKKPESLSEAPFNFPKYNIKTAFTEKTLLGFGANNETVEYLLPSSYDSYCETITDIMKDIPGGITGAIFRSAEGKDMGIPGLTMDQLPDMSPPELEPIAA
jgi:cholinesterase